MAQVSQDTRIPYGCTHLHSDWLDSHTLVDIVSVYWTDDNVKNQIRSIMTDGVRTSPLCRYLYGGNETSIECEVLSELGSAFRLDAEPIGLSAGLSVWAAVSRGAVQSVMVFLEPNINPTHEEVAEYYFDQGLSSDLWVSLGGNLDNVTRLEALHSTATNTDHRQGYERVLVSGLTTRAQNTGNRVIALANTAEKEELYASQGFEVILRRDVEFGGGTTHYAAMLYNPQSYFQSALEGFGNSIGGTARRLCWPFG
ncbi:uncharacterized protein I303_102203 [Kwoniella dejecticola CBS 10117]|uniref:Uncharacterized protein n=1 Tax=Kwoniella dejecticola CBS 10117 TaxID=1296121 RepID=A0A1A6ABL1_9TREE|nr:uncharacterized protein I303_01656 [Kwoniella dejecticola CBS 10117]OBR87451.1 hypothetical protein I303_01656 [Kwoniella dejecticola CBS 10117]